MLPCVLQQLVTRTATGIKQVLLQQMLQCRFIVRGTRQLIKHRAIPMQAMSFQTVQNVCTGAGFGTWWVEIFDAQQPLAAVLLGADIAADSGQQGAGMQTPRGGRGEATND